MIKIIRGDGTDKYSCGEVQDVGSEAHTSDEGRGMGEKKKGGH